MTVAAHKETMDFQTEVRQLLKPRSAYRDPAFVEQVRAAMAEI